MAKKLIVSLCLLCLIGLAVFAGYRYMKAAQKNQEKGSDKRSKAPVVVNMQPVEHILLRDERVFSGTTHPWSSFDIDPKVSGKLMKLNFDIGDMVKQGDVIAKIDDEEYVQTLRQAEANLEYAKAKYKEAKGMAQLRTSEFKRQQELKKSQVTAVASYESAESAMKSQEATAEMCAAEVKRCEALVENAKLRVEDTTIRADWISGCPVRHVGTRFVDEGSLISTGKPILSIIEINRIKAYVQIIERDYRFLKRGQRAEITTDAYPHVVFDGEISNIGNTLSDKTRNALAVVQIGNDDYRLRPGMFVRVKIVLAEHPNAQVVPVNAVVSRGGVQGVFCYEDGKARFLPVETGISNKEIVQIVKPELKTPVITVGNHLLDDGKEVVISELSRAQFVERNYKRRKQDSQSNADPKAAEPKPADSKAN